MIAVTLKIPQKIQLEFFSVHRVHTYLTYDCITYRGTVCTHVKRKKNLKIPHRNLLNLL